MNVCIKPSVLSGKITAVSSKSYVHRILICAAFSDKPTEIYLNVLSDDILATISCLEKMGASITYNKNNNILSIKPILSFEKEVDIYANESGSTARFLLPVASSVFEEVHITGSGRLLERPFLSLVREMRKNGVEVSSDLLPITTKGLLKSGTFYLEGNISSQYISGLLMALSLTERGEESKIILTSELESKKYVDITIEVMKMFGKDVIVEENCYIIKGGKYISPGKIKAEGDWSNSAFWIVANALGSNISLEGLNYKSTQGDRKIIDILNDTEIDASEIPDLVPILSVLALKRLGKTRIYNAKRLKLKESNRLETIYKSLTALGGNVEITDDEVIINGSGSISGGTTCGYSDHRIIMAAAIASLIAENECIIEGAESVNKSYPEFFEDFKKLGGDVSVL